MRENYSWKKSFTNRAARLDQRETEQRLKQQQDLANTNSRQQANFNQSLTSSGKKLTKKQQQQMIKDQQQLTLNASLNQLNSTCINNNNNNELNLDADVTTDLSKCEVVASALLDLFDVKYSCSFLGIHEQHDLFYSSGNGAGGSETGYAQCRKAESAGGMKTLSLNTFDENKSGLNVLKRLISKTKINRSKIRLTEQVESVVLEQRSVICVAILIRGWY